MIGNKFNNLLILKEAPSYISKNKKGKVSSRKRYHCKCDCGNEFIADGTRLRNQKIKRCAYCSYKLRPQSMNRYSSEERLYKLHIKNRCKKANIENDLSLEQFTNLINKNCNYCNIEPRIVNHLLGNKHSKRTPIKFNGIDRKDPKVGYLLHNCVPCCWNCNRMKGTLTEDEFYEKIEIILNRRKQ